uniref:Uncharacterized protein n=1 Tax=Meloidogyne incognita TaxID=6306 RepID=A0A914LU13_MELIC
MPGLDQGLGFSCTQAKAFFDLPGGFPGPGFFRSYRPRIRPRSINQTQSLGTCPDFSKISISNIQSFNRIFIGRCNFKIYARRGSRSEGVWSNK